MRIAFISKLSNIPWGGSEELWCQTAAEAIRRGHEVAACVWRHAQLHQKIRDLQAAGVRLFTWSIPGSDRLARLVQRWHDPFREVRAFAPDVICYNQAGVYGPIFSRQMALRDLLVNSGIPQVMISHMYDELPIESDTFREAARNWLRQVSTVVFVAHRVPLIVERQLAMRLPHAVVVYNPVNMKDISEVTWPQDVPARFACVGRLHGQKGQEYLLQILSSDAWRARDWRLSFYGTGPLWNYLHDLTQFYGLTDRVTFAGHVSDIRGIWAKNHVLLLPSRCEGGTPIVVIEALLCGRPVVMTDVGGAPEWIAEGINGYVAEGISERSFGAAMERLWANRAHWQSMGREARARAAEMFDPLPGRTVLQLIEQAGSTR